MKGPRDTVNSRMRSLQDRAFFIAVNSALYECADAVRAEAFQSISRGSISGKGHVTSKPGDPPHRDSGILQANLETTQPAPFVGRVTSGAPYAATLEFGSSQISARPYLRPARDKVRPKAIKILAKRVNDAINRRKA